MDSLRSKRRSSIHSASMNPHISGHSWVVQPADLLGSTTFLDYKEHQMYSSTSSAQHQCCRQEVEPRTRAATESNRCCACVQRTLVHHLRLQQCASHQQEKPLCFSVGLSWKTVRVSLGYMPSGTGRARRKVEERDDGAWTPHCSVAGCRSQGSL